jgi:prophage regulatory protein
MSHNILRLPAVNRRTGNSRSTHYGNVAKGLWTTPVNLGPRAVGWPDYECDLLIAARISGKTEGEIRDLVTRLEGDRKSLFSRLNTLETAVSQREGIPHSVQTKLSNSGAQLGWSTTNASPGAEK